MVIFFKVFLFVLGACIGSFINVLVSRFDRDQKWYQGRSYCDACKRKLSWWENIPIFSFLFLKGKCRTCHSPIPYSYFWVELFTGFFYVFLFSFLQNNLSSYSIPDTLYPILFVLFSILILIFLLDLRYFIIPDWATLTLIILSLIIHLFDINNYLLLVTYYFLPGLIFFLFFLFLYLVTNGKGMGFGDVKFAFFIGLFLGWPKVLPAFYLSFLTGAVIGVILILLKKKKFGQIVPFGPFLIFSVFLVFFTNNFLSDLISKWLLIK